MNVSKITGCSAGFGQAVATTTTTATADPSASGGGGGLLFGGGAGGGVFGLGAKPSEEKAKQNVFGTTQTFDVNTATNNCELEEDDVCLDDDSSTEDCSLLLLLLHSQLDLWGSPFSVRFLRMWPFFNPTIEVVPFCLRGWCMVGVFVAAIHPSGT